MELENIIMRVDELRDEFDKLRPLREDHLSKLQQKLKLEWNYHSNSIEGNTLSLSETKSFLYWNITAKGKPFRDYIEMKGHNDALNKLYQIVNKDIRITENLIRDFHKMILVEPYTDQDAEINPGKWKTIPNYLYSSTGERIDFASPEEVPQLMNSLINWLENHINPPKRKKKKYELHPLLIAAGFHIQFIKIHPFGDGNGRMARILMNLILMLFGYMPAIIKLDHRKEYYTAINEGSLENPKDLAMVLGEAEIRSLEIAIKAAKGESIEENDDIDKELELLHQKLKAKTIDVPLKSKERIVEILNKVSFSMFEKLVLGLSKFDVFFQSVEKTVHCQNEMNSISIDRNNYSKEEIQAMIIQQISSNTNTIFLTYNFKNLRDTVENVFVNVSLEFRFSNGEYVISELLTNQISSSRYDQYLPEKKQNDWVKKVQREILNKISGLV